MVQYEDLRNGTMDAREVIGRRLFSYGAIASLSGLSLERSFPKRRISSNLNAPSLQIMANPVKEPGIWFLDQNGSAHSAEEFKGIGLVVNFWATWCGPCQNEIASLERLTEILFSHHVAVLPLATDAGDNQILDVRRFYEKYNIRSMPILVDANGVSARRTGSGGAVPYTVVVDRSGYIRARANGAGDWTKGDVKNIILSHI
jgi:thiol-disulfide isomerase/thioredoxin